MSAVHPITEQPIAAFPDTSRPAANASIGLGRYMVRVIQAGVVINQFEAMAEDSTACSMQHMGLVPAGGKLDVMSIAAWEAKRRDEVAARLQRKYSPQMYRMPSEGL